VTTGEADGVGDDEKEDHRHDRHENISQREANGSTECDRLIRRRR